MESLGVLTTKVRLNSYFCSFNSMRDAFKKLPNKGKYYENLCIYKMTHAWFDSYLTDNHFCNPCVKMIASITYWIINTLTRSLWCTWWCSFCSIIFKIEDFNYVFFLKPQLRGHYFLIFNKSSNHQTSLI